MTTYRLGSNPLVHAPGVVAWAINGYHFEKDRPVLLKVLMGWPGLPENAAHALLSGDVPYTIENGDTVVFEIED